MTTTPAPAAPSIEGWFDVGGHDLYLTCRGTGSPTVLYLHGAIFDAGIVPHANAFAVRELLAEDYRVCLYDRRNTGYSDTVDAVQQPQHMLRDLTTLLDVADVDPPYVLLGASWGGLLAYHVANEYPKDVQGVVLLDALFPDELSLEKLWPPSERQVSFVAEDYCCTVERIAHFAMFQRAQRFIGREPDIPLIYLTAEQEPWNESGNAAYDAVVLDVLAGYVDRFSPGELRPVDAPHFMEPAVPDEIAEAVRDVIARIP